MNDDAGANVSTPVADGDPLADLMGLERIGRDLARQGWSVQPQWVNAAFCATLLQELEECHRKQRLTPASTGQMGARNRDPAIRGDWTLWFDGASAVQGQWLQVMEKLRAFLNETLFMGLFEVEAHYALYPPGTGYVCHRDAFQRENTRRVSTVLYLNPAWQRMEGGELVLYEDCGAAERQRVLPHAGTLAVFLSEEIPHAVLPAQRWRASVAAWLRVRGDTMLQG